MHCGLRHRLMMHRLQTIKIIDSTRGQLKYNLLKDRRHIVGRVCVLTMECLLGAVSFVLISTPHSFSAETCIGNLARAWSLSCKRKRFRPTPHEIGLLKPDFVLPVFPNEFGEVLTYSRSPDIRGGGSQAFICEAGREAWGYSPADSGPLNWTPCYPPK